MHERNLMLEITHNHRDKVLGLVSLHPVDCAVVTARNTVCVCVLAVRRVHAGNRLFC